MDKDMPRFDALLKAIEFLITVTGNYGDRCENP